MYGADCQLRATHEGCALRHPKPVPASCRKGPGCPYLKKGTCRYSHAVTPVIAHATAALTAGLVRFVTRHRLDLLLLYSPGDVRSDAELRVAASHQLPAIPYEWVPPNASQTLAQIAPRILFHLPPRPHEHFDHVLAPPPLGTPHHLLVTVENGQPKATHQGISAPPVQYHAAMWEWLTSADTRKLWKKSKQLCVEASLLGI